MLNKFNPIIAHKIAVLLLNNITSGLIENKHNHSLILEQDVLGKTFKHPLGISAGFDKNGTCYKGLLNLGFSHVEVGTVTLRPHFGNRYKRIVRLGNNTIINNLGLPNDGMNKIYKRLNKNVSVNIASDDISDYKILINKFSKCTDYITINLSCPNVNKNDLQLKNILKNIPMDDVPILLKLSPTISKRDLQNVCNISKEYGIRGLVISNTIPDILGGISGSRELFKLSNENIKYAYKYLDKNMVIIGSGGISSAEDAYEMIKSGASLIQIYSSFIYNGPQIINDILYKLSYLLQNDGFVNIFESIGYNHKI